MDVLGGFTLSWLQANTMTVNADGLLIDEIKWYNLNAIASKENYNISSGFNKQVKESFLARSGNSAASGLQPPGQYPCGWRSFHG